MTPSDFPIGTKVTVIVGEFAGNKAEVTYNKEHYLEVSLIGIKREADRPVIVMPDEVVV